MIPSPATPPTLLVDPARASSLHAETRDLPSWDLDSRQLCDLELLLCGGFAPLTGFLGRAATLRSAAEMRLPDGTLWPMPIVLDVSRAVADRAVAAGGLVLRDGEGVAIAVLRVGGSDDDVWELDRPALAAAVCGSEDPDHPGVHMHLAFQEIALGGRIEGLALPSHYDHTDLRKTPAAVRAELAAHAGLTAEDRHDKGGQLAGPQPVVAFQTRNPLHRAHHALTRRAMDALGASLLLHPVVGLTKPGDVDHHTRVRCYRALAGHYPAGRFTLALLPLAMRMAGPREAVWHAAIRKNYGATHFIVGRDHAGPGADRQGRPFYGPYDAQQLVRTHARELGIGLVSFEEMVFVPAASNLAASAATPADDSLTVAGEFVQRSEVPAGATPLALSGSELRRRLSRDEPLPAWFTFPEIAAELRRSQPPRHRQGFTVFFTGLSGAGKSTIANILLTRLLERDHRAVTLLDGDLVRRNLSSELGFSREHRDLNVRRIGYVAAEITKHGGIALCAPIAPYDATRRAVRAQIADAGGFVLVHIATPIEVCEQRDRKGLYAKARAGLVASFTGISDPYEPPVDAEVVLDTTTLDASAAADAVLTYLTGEGYLAHHPSSAS